MANSQAVEHLECTLNLENWLAEIKNKNKGRHHQNMTLPNNL
jgi:hypothetical protein